MTLPLKGGGVLNLGWIRMSGQGATEGTYTNGWNPAGAGALFAFLPRVNTTDSLSRRQYSENGSLDFSSAGVPQSKLPTFGNLGPTYFTVTEPLSGTYYEYWAGTDMTLSPAFGTLNRFYDLNGNQLQYHYTVSGSLYLLRKITGSFVGNVVPYFEYASEASPAPITKIYLRDLTSPSKSRTTYFEYTTYSSNPYLSRIISPNGCVRKYDPLTPIPTFGTYALKREVDPDGYQTYFRYDTGAGIVYLGDTLEPEGRTTYWRYVNPGDTRISVVGRDWIYMGYLLAGGGGEMTAIRKTVDVLGNTTYYDQDFTIYRTTTQTDANGNVTTFEYPLSSATPYALSRKVSLFNGAQTYYGYSATDYDLALELGPRHVDGTFGVATYYAYDGRRNRTRMTDALGNATLYGRDTLGRLVRLQNARTAVTYFNYGTISGTLDSQVDAAGNMSYFGYDSFANVTASVGARWPEQNSFRTFATYYEYDSLDRRTKKIDPLANVTYYDWTSRGDPLDIVDPRKTVTAYTYNAFRLLTQETVTDRAGTVLTQVKHGYDLYKNRLKTLDGLGRTTYFGYDAIDRLVRRQDALLGTTYFAYDQVGNLTTTVDSLGRTTTDFYDPLSRRSATLDALGSPAYFFYDLADNRTGVVDFQGNATYYFYDALDRLQGERDPLGNPTYFFYDEVGNASVRRDARQSTSYYFYDALDRRTAVRDAAGSHSYFAYDAAGNLTRSLDARSNATYFIYDALDRLQVGRDALLNCTYYFYDGVGNTTHVRDARGNTTYYFFDGLNRTTVTRDAQANAVYYFYDAASNRTRAVDPRGNPTYYFYDALDRLSVTRSALAESTYFFYDAVGNRILTRDARGNSTYFFYDALNRLSVRQDALGNVSYFSYDRSGNVTSLLDARGFQTTLDYDALDRAVALLAPETVFTYFGYDAGGNVVARLDAAGVSSSFGAATYFFYDALNRVSSWSDALTNTAYFTYDPLGNVTVVTNPLSHSSSFGYDALSRLARSQDAAGGTTYFEYDAVGNPAKVIDANVHAGMTRYDSVDRPDSLRSADGGSTYFFYDKSSNRSRELSPRGYATYYGYDAVNRLVRIQDALARTLYFEYDPASNLSKSIDAEGASNTCTYDAVNRRTQCVYAVAGSVVSAGLRSDPYFAYDQTGNRVQMGDLWGLHMMGYDGLGRMIRHVFPRGQAVYFEYTPQSRPTRITYPGASGTATIEYDLLQRPTQAVSPSGAATYFKFDAAGNLTAKVLGNSAQLSATYDPAERISSWRHSDKNAGALTSFDYTRDAKGLVTKAVREVTYTVYYTYDACDRLSSEVWTTGSTEVYGYRYAYDLAGNRTIARANGSNTYYFYDKANQLTVRGTTSAFASPTYYFYDKNGSVTAIKEPSKATYFAFNAAGLVARIRWGDSSSTYFFYDGNLQRYGMNALGAMTYFLWDGPNLLQELNADGSVKEEHTNAKSVISGIGQLVETYRPSQPASDQKNYPVMDARGTITKWLKSDGTTVLASREYDAFGNLIPNSSSGTWPGRFGYQGQTWLELTSSDATQRLLLSPTRIYDPAIGRFLQNDLKLDNRPAKQYLYCLQNPVAFVDPEGLDEKQRALLKDMPKKYRLSDRDKDLMNKFLYSDEQSDTLWAQMQALKDRIAAIKKGCESVPSMYRDLEEQYEKLKKLQEQHYRDAQNYWQQLEQLDVVKPGYQRWNSTGANPEPYDGLFTLEWDEQYLREKRALAEEEAQGRKWGDDLDAEDDRQYTLQRIREYYSEENVREREKFKDDVFQNPGLREKYFPGTGRVDNGNYGSSHPENLPLSWVAMTPGVIGWAVGWLDFFIGVGQVVTLHKPPPPPSVWGYWKAGTWLPAPSTPPYSIYPNVPKGGLYWPIDPNQYDKH
jgi:RHS repeat-associated protein